LLKLGNDKVSSTYDINSSCLRRYLFSFFWCVFFKKRAKAYAKQLFIEHYIDFRRERDFVESEKSRNPDERLFFMEIDGIDQSKTLLPQYINPPKNINPDLLFNFHIPDVK
jgi:hypothetical protein